MEGARGLKKLTQQCSSAGLLLEELVGKVYTFSDDGDAMIGTVIGASTTNDGLLRIEVSNREFSGSNVGSILVKNGSEATILVAAKDRYYRIPGQFSLFVE